MEFEFSDKADRFGANIFNLLEKKRIEVQNSGRTVYNLTIGTPDFAPDRHIMQAVSKAALDAENYKYSLKDCDELVNSTVQWYQRRYGVALDNDEIMSVGGTQEGMGHIALALCNDGDTVLVPDPCYPIFEIGPFLCGAKIAHYRLDENNGYLPDFDAIGTLADNAKVMVVSYPLNPVCATAPEGFYEKLIKFAKEHNIIIVHDNAYSEIIYDGVKGRSFLEFEGAKDIGVEFNSLSKTYQITGLRVSFLLGNRDIIAKYKAVRSQYDYGMSYLSQKAAIAALNGEQGSVKAHCDEYQRRRDALCDGLTAIGWEVQRSKGTMFVWAKCPRGYEDDNAFCIELVEKSGLLVTPGSSFGEGGKGFVRMALVLPEEKMKEIVSAVDKSGILR